VEPIGLFAQDSCEIDSEIQRGRLGQKGGGSFWSNTNGKRAGGDIHTRYLDVSEGYAKKKCEMKKRL
jgi:hypothetical protein